MRESRSFVSVCSGIEAASVAWEPLGWSPLAFSEIAPFPSAVLAHRWPHVPNLGDFTKITLEQLIELLGPVRIAELRRSGVFIGGTPCQSFSIAGLRLGLLDPRGNLALAFLRLLDLLRPRWVVWENVPGVLSSISHGAPDPCPPPPPVDLGCDGAEVETEDEYSAEEVHAFNSFLAGLRELGYGFSYRVLDAQYFGVAQRRRRVFVVGHLGDWRPAAAVLFERDCLSGNPAPRRQAGTRVAGTLEARAAGGGWDPRAHGAAAGHLVADRVAPCLDASFARLQGASGQDLNHGHGHLVPCGLGEDGEVARTLTASLTASLTATGRLDPNEQTFVAGAYPTLRAGQFRTNSNPVTEATAVLAAGAPTRAVALSLTQRGRPGGRNVEITEELACALTADGVGGGRTHSNNVFAPSQMAVRRITPVEAEELQGFPRNHTLLPGKWRLRNPQDRAETLAYLIEAHGLTPLDAAELVDCPDGPRYHALGNSMAVPVIRWLGERIDLVDSILARAAAA